MDRQEAEKRIYEHLLAIKEIYKEYNPDGAYLSMCLHETGNISANNATWEKADNARPIDFWVNMETGEVEFVSTNVKDYVEEEEEE